MHRRLNHWDSYIHRTLKRHFPSRIGFQWNFESQRISPCYKNNSEIWIWINILPLLFRTAHSTLKQVILTHVLYTCQQPSDKPYRLMLQMLDWISVARLTLMWGVRYWVRSNDKLRNLTFKVDWLTLIPKRLTNFLIFLII